MAGGFWKQVAFPGSNGYVNAAAASSPSNVWAAFRPAAGGEGTQVDHWNGRQWSVAKFRLPACRCSGRGNVFATGVGWGGTGGAGGGPAVVLHYNGHGWSVAAAGPAYVPGADSLASDGRGGLWMTSDTHQNYEVLLHYSAGQLVNANEPIRSVATIPGTAEALGGNASPVATAPTVYQYS